MARRKEFPQISEKTIANMQRVADERKLPFRHRVDELARILQAYLDERSGKMLEAFKQLETALLLPPYAYDLLRRIPNEKVSIMEDGVRDMTVIPELPHAKNEADDMQHLAALRCRVHEAIAMMETKSNPDQAQRRLCERLYRAFRDTVPPFQDKDQKRQTLVEQILKIAIEMVPKEYRFQLRYARDKGWIIKAYQSVRTEKIQSGIRTIGALNATITDKTPDAVRQDIQADVDDLDADIKKRLNKPPSRKRGRPKQTNS